MAPVGRGINAGVNAHGARNRHGAGLGNGDLAWIACAREGNRTTIQPGPLVGDVGCKQRRVTFFNGQTLSKIELWPRIGEHESCRGWPKLQFSYWDFSLKPHGVCLKIVLNSNSCSAKNDSVMFQIWLSLNSNFLSNIERYFKFGQTKLCRLRKYLQLC